MFHQKDPVTNRLRVLRSRATFLVVLAGLVFTFMLVAQVAAIKTAKNEETSAAPVIENEREREAAIARLFTNDEIGKAGNNVGLNFSAPLPQGTPTQVKINFDDVPALTNIATRYQNVTFSSPGLSVYTWPENFGSSFPQTGTRGTIDFAGGVHNNHFADFVATFQQPVNDLKFYITDCDNFGTIALLDVYQNNVLTHPNIPVPGGGASHPPIPFNAGAAGYTNITKIVVHDIIDIFGLTYDDFSFAIAAPPSTPTPSPSPTPPQTPGNLRGVPDEESAKLSWSASAGATQYLVKRTGSNCATDTAMAENSKAAVAEELANATLVPVIGTSFIDSGLCSGATYNYVVSAIGPGGESLDSVPVEVTPIPRPGCDGNFKNPPVPVGNFNATGGNGWVMNYRFSADSGMELSNVYLYGRLMAEWMSTPYFIIKAHSSSGSAQKYGQLWANGSNPDGSLRSRLVGWTLNPPTLNKLLLEATYQIDRIPGAPKACLKITQSYEFYAPGIGVPPGSGPPSSDLVACEPSGTVPCAKYRPMTKYEFHGSTGEGLDFINIPQRLHYQVKGTTENSVGMFTDCDSTPCVIGHLFSVFSAKRNPVRKEFWSTVIGQTTGTAFTPPHRDVRFDNFHQTNNRKVSEPSVVGLPGCAECAHNHWRWTATEGARWGGGQPLVLSNNQTVDVGVVLYPGKVNPQAQQQWISLVQGNSLRKVTVDRCRTCIPRLADDRGIDPVFWFSPTGYNPSDTFFYHTAWFNPRPPNTPNGPVFVASTDQSSSTNNLTASQDGPVSVEFGDVYVTGNTTFSNTGIGSLPPLPAGYAALNNTGYSIETTAVVSGPHMINFSAASVTNQTAFDHLRIFHLETDPFDPEAMVWAETTILSPDTPAPDFGAKTLSAKAEDLGVFVIGNEVQAIPNDVADITVSASASANPIVAGNQLTYTIQVTNNGPQMAHEVKLSNGLSPDVHFESATSANGTCKEIDGTVYCKLNSLAAGATATVAIVVTPTEGTGSFPPEGKTIYNGVVAKAAEGDGNIDNNSASVTTLALPNPNKAPTVSITSPQNGALLVGPTNITVNSTATDSDGTISKVEVFDNGELSGQATPVGNNQYVFTKQNASFGVHSLVALGTDNGGRQNLSDAVSVIVNGSATVSITSPAAGTLIAPGSNVTLSASATHPSGSINKVEFFANGQLIGVGNASGSQYSLAWNNLSPGIYTLAAVVTDGAGITTTSLPIGIKVGSAPSVAMTTPLAGSTFPSATNISVSATASSTSGSIARIDFYANGTLIGSASDVGTNTFTVTWRQPADSLYSVYAVATDNFGLTSTSAAIAIGVNTPSPRPGEFIWFDDTLPPGAVKSADGDVDWYFVDKNPVAFSGATSHQSRNFGQLDAPNTSFHQHSFEGATPGFPVNVGDSFFTYVFLDINNMPREIMLQWKDATGWEHRAYWGENRINLGTTLTSRNYRGPLPKAGTWVRLEVPASQVALEGSTVTGMAFTLDGGRATWDLVGKRVENTPNEQPPPLNDFIWVDDAVPAGATQETFNDNWQWLDPHVCGSQGHRSFFTVNQGAGQMRWHAFRGAANPMSVQRGEVLFTYVYLDGNNMPDQLMLQWHDGTNWEHRAYWGENFIGARYQSVGVQGTESQRYMGGLPPANRWVRLEIPASYVGLEGKNVSGMSFGFYSTRDHAGINWDCSGKAGRLTTVPLVLTATSGVWRLKSNNFGYSFNTNDQGEPDHVPQKKNAFFAYPNKAAGTVPMYRFKRPQSDNYEYFYSRCLECFDGHGWVNDGIAFYVFPEPTPNAIPLYLYHDSHFKYFLTIDQNEAAGMIFDAIWAYVPDITPIAPAAPNFLQYQGCYLNWRDNSWNESGFKVERFDITYQNGAPVGIWNQIGTAGTNAVWYKIGCNALPGPYRVRAYNQFGDSAYSNEICVNCYYIDVDPGNSSPETIITSPANGAVVRSDVAIVANASDVDGNGTIARVELFANGVKVSEDTQPPYVFPSNNLALGTYSLTTVVTDSNGATATSAPVNVTLARYDQAITFDWIPDKSYGDAPFALSAVSTAGLPVAFTVVSGPATLSGNTLTITGIGSVTVRASQAGDATYNPAADANRTFNVAGASATITLGNLNQAYDGAPKSVTATTNPAGVTGVSITYNGSATAPTNVGSYAIVASLTNPNYTAANATGTLTIANGSQTISFNAPADRTYGDAPFTLSASSSANLPVGFSIVSGPATVSGNTLTINAAGSVTVRASQSGNANYNAAANVDRTFNVAKASATISLSNLSHVYDGTVKNATATTNPAGLSGVAISYSGPALTPINAGTYSVVATLTNANYTAPNATASLTIAKANPVLTWPNPADIAVGTALNATQLNATANVEGTFTYSPSAGTVLNVGNNQTLSATLTPTISANYNTVSATARINVVAAMLLFDDFNDNSFDSGKWTIADATSPVTVSEQGQQLRITIPPNTAGYNGVVSNSSYDMRGATVEVEMAQPISQAGWCENFIQVSLDGNNYFLIDAGAGSMVFRSMVGGSNDQTVLAVFDPTVNRHWRIRHDQSANTINFETSPDRVSWTLRKTAAVGFSLTTMRVNLFAGAWGTGNSNPGAAGFDNVRLVTNETANSLPNSGPPTTGLVAYWKLDENSGATAADSSTSGIHGALQNGPTWTAGRIGAALNFDGSNGMVSSSGLPSLTNNFTLSFWAYPSASHEIDGEATGGYGGVSGQRYAFWPTWYDGGQCGVGVSVGTNGVSVYEHAANYMPATLVHAATISGWTHVTIIYENRQPRLYLNGILVKTGLTSPMSSVHMNPNYIGGQVYGYYAGKLDEVRVYNRVLTATEVATLPNWNYSAEATKDFSASQNPAGSWSYGYKPTGGVFTLFSGASTGFGAGTSTWALPGQTCCPMVTRNNTGVTLTYPAAPSVVQPADVLNLHPGPNNERSIVRWTAPETGSYSIEGRFQGIDTSGTTTDVLVTHNGTPVFSGNVNGYANSAPFSFIRTVVAGETIEFSVGYGSNGTYNSDSTGLSATINAYGRMNVALSASGAVANASSTYNANYPASGANNGDRKLGYGSGGAWHSSTSTFPQWLQIDFNGTKTIDEVDVFTLQDSYASPAEPTEAMTFTLYGLTAFEVQYWNGGAWAPVPGGGISGNNKVWRKITFAPVTTSKIRVVTNGSVDGWTRVTEVEAWGIPTGSGGSTNGYASRRSITIDHNQVPNTDQANLPILISGTYAYLATAANGGGVQNANGFDVVFTSDPGCTTKLSHEVETYSATTGAVNYWVKVPTVSHVSDTVIYLCYGNPSVSVSQENTSGVWDANFKAAYHLKDGATLSGLDSLANHNLTNNNATATAGKVGGGAAFDGSTQYLSAAQHSNLDWANLRTVEFWMKIGVASQTLPRLFSYSNGTSSAWSISWIDPASTAGTGLAGSFLEVSVGPEATPALQRRTPDGGVASLSTWYHVAVVSDGTNIAAIYLNGAPVTIFNYAGNITNTVTPELNIGRRNNNGRYFNGSIDEARFSSVPRSADWIATEYNNQSSPATFYTISASSGGQ